MVLLRKQMAIFSDTDAIIAKRSYSSTALFFLVNIYHPGTFDLLNASSNSIKNRRASFK